MQKKRKNYNNFKKDWVYVLVFKENAKFIEKISGFFLLLFLFKLKTIFRISIYIEQKQYLYSIYIFLHS